MSYLVVNAGGGGIKKYNITNTCNKPRLVLKNGNNLSYIPVTNSSKKGVRLSNSYIGEYSSYTYTSNKRTVTTGTTTYMNTVGCKSLTTGPVNGVCTFSAQGYNRGNSSFSNTNTDRYGHITNYYTYRPSGFDAYGKSYTGYVSVYNGTFVMGNGTLWSGQTQIDTSYLTKETIDTLTSSQWR